jgi:hypothetical protein
MARTQSPEILTWGQLVPKIGAGSNSPLSRVTLTFVNLLEKARDCGKRAKAGEVLRLFVK